MRRSLILATAAAFLSMFVVFLLKPLSDAVFLAAYGAAYVPHFTALEAVSIIVASSIYSIILRRGPSAVLDISILLMLGASALVSPFAIERGGVWVFAVALALNALATVASLAVWNAATGVVRGRRARAFVPRASAAATAGAICGGFSASGLAAMVDLTWLGLVATVPIAILVRMQGSLLRIGRSHGSVRSSRHRASNRRPPPVPDSSHGTSHGARALAGLAMVAAACAAILTAVLDLGFKANLEARFDRQQLGVFFAGYYGIANILILLLQSLLTSRLLVATPLRFALSLQPIAMLMAALTWSVFPGLLWATITRGSETILKFAVTRPAQEIALMPLSEGARAQAKVLIRGVFTQGGNAAAGVALIFLGPWLLAGPMRIPVVVAVLACGWLYLQRRTGFRYLDVLGSSLGMRGLLLRGANAETPLDRDSLNRMVNMLGSNDDDTAQFGRELITSAVSNSAVFAPYLEHPNPRVRQTLYRRLAVQPSRACAVALRQAVGKEVRADELPAGMGRDGEFAHRHPLSGASAATLAEGLRALGALGDDSMVAQARALAVVPPQDCEGAALGAWQYLAAVGALDNETGPNGNNDGNDAFAAVFQTLLQRDGVRAAGLYLGRRKRHNHDIEPYRRMMLDALSRRQTGPSEAAREALRAAAAIGELAFLTPLIAAIAARDPHAEEALLGLDEEGFANFSDLLESAHDRATDEATEGVSQVSHASPYRQAPSSELSKSELVLVWTRALRWLRGSELESVIGFAVRSLEHEDGNVRNMAVHLLLHRSRGGELDVPRRPLIALLGKVLDHFQIYVRARQPYPREARESSIAFRHDLPEAVDTELFFVDELERQTERALSKVCEVLALLGHPSVVFAAARELRAPALKRRLKAVDILQEVAPVAERPRLFRLLERYLRPQRPTPGARNEVCALDPWLARSRGNELIPIQRRLSGLRAVPLFDEVAGEALVDLAEKASEEVHEKGYTVVEQGTPGDALFIVLEGKLVVERDGTEVARLIIGNYFGELALIDGSHRQASVRTLTYTRLLRLPRAPFLQAMADHAEIRIGLMRGLAHWLRAASSSRRDRTSPHHAQIR